LKLQNRYSFVTKQTGLIMKDKLRVLLIKKSFKYSNKPVFTLVSGRKSQFYIDCKMTTLYSKGMVYTGNIIYDMIADLSVKGIGGLTLGADPIAQATAMIAGQKGSDLISFVIRKEPKKHGLMKWIEGDIHSGDSVVIIDDVITTGGSTIQAIDKAEESGLYIVKVLVLVDREEGGRENIRDRGYEVESVFTKSELFGVQMIINIIKKADRQSQSLMTDLDLDVVYGYYLQYYLENDNVEVLDSEELEKKIKKLGLDVRDDKIVRDEQFKQLIER